MRFCVVGAGAVGGYFGGRLARAGESVTFLARGQTLAALQKEGLHIGSSQGRISLTNVHAVDNPKEVGQVDVVLVAVKAWQVPEVAEAIHPLIAKDTAILPLQNGVEAALQLASVHGQSNVLGGMCRIVAVKTEPNQINHVGVEPLIVFGELDNRPSRRVADLAAVFQRAGVSVKVAADIKSSIWQKFLFIAPVSGVGAVARVPFGLLRSTPETRELIQEAMLEISALAEAHGVVLPGDVVMKTMAFFDGMPAEVTASMQRDIMQGRPSELEAINGAVVRLGGATSVAVPVNRFVYSVLLPLEKLARQPIIL